MKIIVDAFGGDNAPLEIVKGSIEARAAYGVEIILCGDEGKLLTLAKEENFSLEGIEIVDAPEVIEMEDEPTAAIRQKKNSSMVVALNLLKEGRGDAVVSAGSTGALLAGATFIVKRIKGMKRAALATMLPAQNGPVLLIDTGANAECKPEYLLQFGIAGSLFMEKVGGVKNPKVGLINIGSEESKGTDLQREAYGLLKGTPEINFMGNLEPRYLPANAADVAVADGFTGNIVLKMMEGMGKFFSLKLKELFKKNIGTMIGALFVKGGLASLKKTMDYTEYGGAPLLGIAKPVIKAHGSSNAKAFASAIRQARDFAASGMTDELVAYFAKAAADEKSET